MTYIPMFSRYETKSSSFVASAYTHYGVDASSSTLTVTLPPPTRSGAWVRFKLVDATNDVTLTPSSGTVDGQASRTMGNPQESVTLVSDGTKWEVI